MTAWQKSEGFITAISYSDPTWSTGVQSEHELYESALKMRSMWQRGNMVWRDFLILKVRILQLLYRLEWMSKILVYSLHLGEPFTSRSTGCTKSFPSLMVSSYSSCFFPFNSLFLQNLIYPFFLSLSFVSLPLCSSFPACCGVSLIPHSYCAFYIQVPLKKGTCMEVSVQAVPFTVYTQT